MQMKIEKSLCGFCISAFELVALTLAFTEKIHLLSGVTMLTKSLKI